jgi:hypothetical protein
MSSTIIRAVRRVPKRVASADIPGHSSALQAAARAPGYPSVLGNIFDSATYTPNPRPGGGLMMNGVPIEELGQVLRRGELIRFSRLVNGGPVSNSAESAFRRTLFEVPDNAVRQLDELTAVQRIRHSDLDLRVDGMTSGNDLRNAMTPAARSKFESAMAKLKSLTVAGGTAVGVFALIMLGIDFYDSMVVATNNRRGCFYAIKTGNNIRSCRLTSRTCWEPRLANCEPGANPPSGMKFNVATMLLDAISGNDTLNGELVTALEREVTAETIASILSDGASFTAASEFFEANDVQILSPCAVSEFEGDLALCRACDPTAVSNTLSYFDDSLFNDNETLVCVPTGSVLETLVDLGFGLGVDLLGGFGNKLSTSISGNIWLIFIIIVVIVVTISIMKLFKKDQ